VESGAASLSRGFTGRHVRSPHAALELRSPAGSLPHVQTEEANKQVTGMLQAEEVALQLRLIGQRIRSSLDRGSIASTALLELRDMLGLENAALWLPGPDGASMELAHECEHRPSPVLTLIPSRDSTVTAVSQLVARPTSPSGRPSAPCAGQSFPELLKGCSRESPGPGSGVPFHSWHELDGGEGARTSFQCGSHGMRPSPSVQAIHAREPIVLPADCQLAELSALPPPLGTGRVGEGCAMAFAVPLLDPEEPSRRPGLEYGIVVLVLPSDGGAQVPAGDPGHDPDCGPAGCATAGAA